MTALALAAVLALHPAMTPGIEGRASWFHVEGNVAAAGPALREWLGPDWRGQHVRVSAGGRSVVVAIVDWCQCYRGERRERVIDLSDGAFARLAPPSVGLVRVTVSRIVPPATDAGFRWTAGRAV